MADYNDNQNGVFGGLNFSGLNTEGEVGKENSNNSATSYFEGTIAGNNTSTSEKSFESWNVMGNSESVNNKVSFEPIAQEKAITKQGLWTRIRAFLFQEIDLNAPIKVELTPGQQKVEDEINEFLHQEVSFKGIFGFFKASK